MSTEKQCCWCGLVKIRVATALSDGICETCKAEQLEQFRTSAINKPHKNMTHKQAVAGWSQGQMLQIGEYRSSEAETIRWRDKVSGATMTAPMLRHVVEFGAKSAVVSERVDRATFKPEEYIPPFSKGEQVVVKINSLTIDRGVMKLDGTLEALQLAD